MKKVFFVIGSLICFSLQAKTVDFEKFRNLDKEFKFHEKLLVSRDFSPLAFVKFIIEKKGYSATDIIRDNEHFNSNILGEIIKFPNKECYGGNSDFDGFSTKNAQCKDWRYVGTYSETELEELKIKKPKAYLRYQNAVISYNSYIADLKLAIKYLVDRGVDINYNNYATASHLSENHTALADSIRSFYDVDLVKYLVSLGAKPNLVFRAGPYEESAFSVASMEAQINGMHQERLRVLNYFKHELKLKYVDDRCTVIKHASVALLELWAKEDGVEYYRDLDKNCDNEEIELSKRGLWSQRNRELGWTLDPSTGEYYQ